MPAHSVQDLVVYLQGQRWGSAIPAPSGVGGRDSLGRGGSTVRLMNVDYESATPDLVYQRPQATVTGERLQPDFLFDDLLGLYYAGDFTSHRSPGFEAACLSGIDVAEHIAGQGE